MYKHALSLSGLGDGNNFLRYGCASQANESGFREYFHFSKIVKIPTLRSQRGLVKVRGLNLRAIVSSKKIICIVKLLETYINNVVVNIYIYMIGLKH